MLGAGLGKRMAARALGVGARPRGLTIGMADGCIPVPVVRSRGAGGGALAMPVLLCDWIPGMAEAPWFG